MVRKDSTFKQRDMTRGLKAAKLAGIDMRVDVTKDGLRFTPMPPVGPAPGVKPKDAEPAAAGLRKWD